MSATPEEKDAMPAAQPKKTNLWIWIGLGCLAIALLLAGGCVAMVYYTGIAPGKWMEKAIKEQERMEKEFAKKAKESEQGRREFEEKMENTAKGGTGKVQVAIPEGMPPEVRKALIEAVEKNIGRKLREGEVVITPAETP